MGAYFNPGNRSFQRAVRSKIYVDKTSLIEHLNECIFTENNCIALSHARRFGKSQAARMIDAYYSLGSDSKEIFLKFKIAEADDFEEHLNKYNVIHLDIASISDFHKLPTGKGFADFAFIPRREAGSRPAMIVELKWNKTADTAIKQIKENRYTGALSKYGKEILLVGISYDKEDENKKHSCVIESIEN